MSVAFFLFSFNVYADNSTKTENKTFRQQYNDKVQQLKNKIEERVGPKVQTPAVAGVRG
jgi:aromatic ring-cleaving dioxygenase